jgi:hypothetical protein
VCVALVRSSSPQFSTIRSKLSTHWLSRYRQFQHSLYIATIMPFTLGLTAEEKRAADNAAIRLSNLRAVDFRLSSYLYGLFVVEEAKNLTARPRLFASAYQDIQHLAEVVTGARHPDATIGWYEEERRAHLARALLSLAYLNSVQEWIDAARVAMRRWRFNDGGVGAPPELPKVGWERRDAIETALEELGKASSLDAVPSTWIGYKVVPTLRHLEPGVEGDPVDTEDEDESGLSGPDGDIEAEDESDSEDEEDDEEDTDSDDSEDDFQIVIRGSRLNAPPPYASGRAESNELRRMSGGIPDLIDEIDSDEEPARFDELFGDNSPSDDTESELDSDEDLWDTPNSEEAPGSFNNGRFIQ